MRHGHIVNSKVMSVCTLKKGLFLLTMKLRGETARRLCLEMADKVGRYLAGDLKLIEEIKENARTIGGVHSIMQGAMNSQQLALEENVQAATTETTTIRMGTDLVPQTLEQRVVVQQGVEMSDLEQRITVKRSLEEMEMQHKYYLEIMEKRYALEEQAKENEAKRQDMLKENEAKRQKCLREQEDTHNHNQAKRQNTLKENEAKRQERLREQEDTLKENEAKRQKCLREQEDTLKENEAKRQERLTEQFVIQAKTSMEVKNHDLEHILTVRNVQQQQRNACIAGGMYVNYNVQQPQRNAYITDNMH